MDLLDVFAVKIHIVTAVILMNVTVQNGVKTENAPLKRISTVALSVQKIVQKVFWGK